MINLHRFFHFHHGNARDQVTKLAGSFVAAISLAVLGASLSAESAFIEKSYVLSMLVPEPAIVEAGENDVEIAMAVAPVQTDIPQTPPLPEVLTAVGEQCFVEGKPVPCAQPTSLNSSPQTSVPAESQTCWVDNKQVSCEEMEKEQERMNRQNVLQERKQMLEEMRNQKRELKTVCNQLKRLKGAESDAAACNDLFAKIIAAEQQLKAPPAETDDLREFINEFRDMQVWDEINKMRFRANLPRELNQFFKDLLRVERMLKQKSFQKIIGLNFEQIAGKFSEIKQAHAEAKACYDSGDFECANEKLNEARQENYPGELEGSLHMLRSINEQLRNIRDKELQTEIQELLAPAIEQLNGGEWREAQQELNGMQHELMQILEQIMRTQQRRGGPSGDTMKRLERFMEKYSGNGGGDEFEGGSVQEFPMMKQF